MNTRQGMLVTAFTSSLFMNFASIYWTMWSVLSMAFFVITLTDFMFFEVRIGAREHLGERSGTEAAMGSGDEVFGLE